ncbi:conserved hypothetical protein [Alteromonas macleodii]
MHVKTLVARKRAAQRVSVSIGYVDLIKQVYIIDLVSLFVFVSCARFS